MSTFRKKKQFKLLQVCLQKRRGKSRIGENCCALKSPISALAKTRCMVNTTVPGIFDFVVVCRRIDWLQCLRRDFLERSREFSSRSLDHLGIVRSVAIRWIPNKMDKRKKMYRVYLYDTADMWPYDDWRDRRNWHYSRLNNLLRGLRAT